MASPVEEIQESPVEEIQEPGFMSIAVGQGNNLECPPKNLPKAKATTVKVFVGRISGTVRGILGSGITWIFVLVEENLIGPIRERLDLAGEGVPVHGNGMPIEPGHDAGDVEDGGAISISPGIFTDNPDQEGTEGLISEEADQVSVGSMLLGNLTDAAKAAEYFKHPKTYLSGFLFYGLHSSLGTLKEGFPKPTPAKKALWYLLFGNVGTIFVLFTMLARAPNGSDKAKLLVKSMTAAGVLMFGLNLALLYLKYQP